MRTVSWILKYILLPLTPFGVGVLVRVLHSGQIEFASLNPSELSFSMAMLALVVSVSAGRITDPELRQALTHMFHLGLFLALVLFSWSIFVQTQIELAHADWWEKMAAGAAAAQRPAPTPDQVLGAERLSAILGRLRLSAVVLSSGVIIAAVVCKSKYNLEDS